MKFLVVAAVLSIVAVAFALTPAQKAKLEEISNLCTKQAGVSADAVKKLKEGDTTDNSKEIKAFTDCYFKNVNFLNDAGDIDEQKALAAWSADALPADKPKIQQYIKDCIAKAGTVKSDVTLNFFRCSQKVA